VLARYVVIRGGGSMTFEAAASTLIFYCITGTGCVAANHGSIRWSPGDVFLLPGGDPIELKSLGEANTVLWVVGDDRVVQFSGMNVKSQNASTIEPVHYPAQDIRKQIDRIYEAEQEADTAGRAIIFSSARHDAIRNISPWLTLALNTLDPQTVTRPHRHNSVAVMLVLEGEDCYSTAGELRKDWVKFSTTITPPTSLHTHHNEGAVRAELLIVQDGGFFTHSRAAGFSFD
jgi:gentisate 1,2-dioxygenase